MATTSEPDAEALLDAPADWSLHCCHCLLHPPLLLCRACPGVQQSGESSPASAEAYEAVSVPPTLAEQVTQSKLSFCIWSVVHPRHFVN